MSYKRLLTWLLSLTTIAVLSIGGYFYIQKDVFIVIDGHKKEVHTFKSTVQEVLDESGVTVKTKDRVTPNLAQVIRDKSEIRITRAIPVKVIADGKEVVIETIPVEVSKVMNLAGVTLGKLDYVSKDAKEIVRPNDKIKVTRVKHEYLTQTMKIAYTLERRPDNSLEKGMSRLVRDGADGLAEKTILVTYEDGKEVSRAVASKKVIKEPKSRLIAMGTLSSVSRSGTRFDFDRAIVVEATAYTHTGHRTATGAYPEVGTVAVDPRVIPLGSKLYIEGYGFAKAQDVGGAIKGSRIDVFLDSDSAARRWGRKTVKAYVLK